MDDELFELCRQVYEATGWGDTHQVLVKLVKHWIPNSERIAEWHNNGDYPISASVPPLYTSDYLLEKLLPITPVKFYRAKNGNISLFWEPIEPVYEDMMADTPLKALLRLTLALQEAKLL